MKCGLILFILLFLTACSERDNDYYFRNPHKLKQAISACPQQKPKKLTCDELTAVEIKFQTLANELRQNPQKFGLKILALQEKIAKKELSLQKKNDQKMSENLKKDKKTLAEWIAVVSYYESPKGVTDENSSQ